ncbi:MAG: hypothetical protein WA814_01600 [Candidatus Baltobacteraceae bacterium]
MPRAIATLAKGRTAVASLLIFFGLIAYMGGIATMPFHFLALHWPPISQLLMFSLGLSSTVFGYVVYNPRRAWLNVLAILGFGAIFLALNLGAIAILFRDIETKIPNLANRAAPLCLASAVVGTAAMVYAYRKRRTMNSSA